MVNKLVNKKDKKKSPLCSINNNKRKLKIVQKNTIKTKIIIKENPNRKSLPWSAYNNKTIAKRYYGGKFPIINGKKHKYPNSSNDNEWMKLINIAITYDKNRVKALAHKTTVPICKDKRIEYILFHACPKQIKRRTIRNQHRSQHGLKKGDKRHVHHNNPNTMAFNKTVIVDRCAHKKLHGQRCLNSDK